MAGRGTVARHGEVAGQRGTQTRRPTESAGRREGAPVPDHLPMLRNSERGTVKKCEFLWDLTYNRKLKPYREMPALRFGSLVHKALAAYYVPGIKRGESPITAFERAYAEDLAVNEEVFGVRVDEEESWVDALELGLAMMQNYLDQYGADDDWEVLVTEHPFQTYVAHPVTGKPWFIYVGILDGVWRKRSDKTIWVPDHKTTSGLGDRKLTYLQVDDQAGGYWSWGVDWLRANKLLKPDQQLNGMLYNFLRKAMPDERTSKFVNGRRLYLNLDGSVSKKQPSPYFARIPIVRDEFDRAEARRRSMVDFARLEMFRSGQLELSKTPGMFTCPSCAVRDICELHETGNDYESFIAQTTRTWEPYAEHEIYDGR